MDEADEAIKEPTETSLVTRLKASAEPNMMSELWRLAKGLNSELRVSQVIFI